MATGKNAQGEQPAQPATPETPHEGGSYLVDEQTGAHQLVERTQPSAGRAVTKTVGVE